MEPLAPAAPAPPAAAPDTISASIDAVNRNDFAAFDAAELGKRTGKPVADVEAPDVEPVTPAPGAPAAPERQLSKRQQQLNDSIREAVERATADSAKRIADLELRLNAKPVPPAAPPVAPAPPAKATPEYKRIMALEGAPKLADFDSVEEHAFAAAEFIDSTRTKERADNDARMTGHTARVAAEKAVDDAFFEQLDTAKTDPEFTKQLAPEVLALTPIEWLPRDQAGRFLDAQGQPMTTGPLHVVASELRKSPMVRALMLHFSQQPADLARIAAGPPSLAAIPVEQRTHAQKVQHVRWIDHEMKRLEGRLAGAAPPNPIAAPAAPAADPVARSPITAAPPPPPTLRAAGSTSDPKAAALARSDFAEYDRLETQERLAKLSPR